ncbi:unnamed protein product [Cuscuta epithymum]|uniref:Uncharacterized protein n=1 Tax=Cuscuta epithymum TaxID=186058 RepID=A0AAV0C9Q5_9ASTE|nr:unnamed protein product [Cuscuta epithymum]CAH9122171.1 unnamed protein product [Cuscuta epithymum]
MSVSNGEHQCRSSRDVIQSGDGSSNEEAGGASGGGIDPNERIEGDANVDNRKGGKKFPLFWFRKVKRSAKRSKHRSSTSCVPGCFGLAALGGSGGDCCLCFKPPQTADSSSESQTSDPNSPNFSRAMLRGLIEKNDFYSKECNPH